MPVQYSSHSIWRRVLCVFRSQCSWESVLALESIENLVWSRVLRLFLMDLARFLQLDDSEVCIEVLIYCREGSFFNSDVNYVVNSLFVSVMCGLMESLTIPNYDNYTIFFMGILAFHFVHSLVCETNHLEGPKNSQFCRILYSKAARRREQSQPLPQPQIIYFPLFAFSSNAPKCTGKKGIKRHVVF